MIHGVYIGYSFKKRFWSEKSKFFSKKKRKSGRTRFFFQNFYVYYTVTDAKYRSEIILFARIYDNT